MKKVLIVFGTRPEAIKMAPVVLEFKKYKNSFTTKVCVTAQHREMLDQVLDIFEITPEYDLNIMQPSQDLFDITNNVLLKIRDVLSEFRPDLVLVHGDTTTSATAALAAFYMQIPVGHVEAGLRTGNIYSPWPEEMNRKITGSIATFHFSPTLLSKKNLLAENVEESKILVTGNTVIDAIFLALNKIKNNIKLQRKIDSHFKKVFGKNYEKILNSCFILVTGHRRENFGEGFVKICKSLKKIAINNPSINIIYPVHLNPNVQNPVNKLLKGINNIHLITPQPYLDFIYLMEKSYIILTDSGGIQEEAPSLGKPVLVMRNTTERPEAVDAGTVKLVGTNINKIYSEVARLIENNDYYIAMSKAHNPYGDGTASEKIIEFCLNIN